MVYTGNFEVEDGDFTLHAKRFILRDDEISFLFEGVDEYGKFIIEGVATKSETGFYLAPNNDLKYMSYKSDDKASIRIDSVELSKKQQKCKVSGVWIQMGETCTFTGLLGIFNA